MKRAIAGILVLLVAIGVGIGYKALGPGRAPKGAAGKGKGELVYATAERLAVSGVGGYQLSSVDFGEGPVPLIRVPLDTWGGYAALFAANGGAKPSKDSLFYKKGKFAVELVNEESASQQLSGYASGRYPIIWAPMDSLPVLYDALKGDRRVVPKVLGLFDWSSGGDGIIVKNTIKRPSDLKDRVILTSSNSPFSFLLLWYLAQNGLNPQDVKVVWIDDGEKAFETFKNDDRIVAWVSWTPFITDAIDPSSPNYVADTRLLISSRDANQLIADTYVVRNDLMQDKPEMMTAFVEAMIEGSQSIDAATYRAMAEFYKLPGGENEAKEMLRDVHVANWPESLMFFDADNQIGAHKIFLLAQEYYKQAGALPENASYDPERVLTDSVVSGIKAKGLFAGQKNRVVNSFNEKAAFDIADLENQRVVLTNDVRLYFEAQRIDFDPSANTAEAKENMKQLALVAEQTKFLSTTIVKLIGHLDTAKVEEFRAKGKQEFIAASAQAKLLSKKRAEFVKKTLVERYKVDADRVVTEGRGWDEPVDASDPAKNRRVEVQFISLE